MGSGDERTQEAACINHKPSLLGVKQRGRNIAGLTSPCRLQISTYKKKNSGILQLKCQSWEGGGQHGHGSFTGIAGAVVPSVLTFPLSVPIVSAVMALRIPKAQLFALSAWHPYKAPVSAQSGRFQPKGLQMDLTFPKDGWDFVPSEHSIFKTGTEEAGKATQAS